MCTNLMKTFAGPFTGRVSARTMDFGMINKPLPVTLKPNIVAFPIGTSFPTAARWIEKTEEVLDLLPKRPLNWKNLYGFLGVDIGPYIFSKIKFDTDKINPIFLDGMNEKGLSAATLWLDGSVYQTEANSDTNVSFLDVVAYILGTCANVAEVKDALQKISVVSPGKFLQQYPAHYVFIDPNPENDALIVEYIGGIPQFYHVANGVLTNEPPYPEMLKILDGPPYDKMTLYNKTVGGNPGLLNLPADSSPISRFVRATKFSEALFSPSTTQEAVALCQVIIQNLQVPIGTVLDKNFDQSYDFTHWTVVRDHASKMFYYETMSNQLLRRVDLNKIDFSSIREISYPIDKGPWFVDETSNF